VACAVGPSVNPLQNRETHVNIVLQCMYPFFEQPKYERKSCLASFQVLPRSQLIFPFKTWFFKNLFEFSAPKFI
jgi:hypothetical protein